MTSKTAALLAIVGLALSACAGADSVAPPAAPMVAPVAQATPAPLPGVGREWEVRRVTCGQLLAAPEPERRSATMFYYGYLAGRARIDTIDTAQMDGDIRRAMDQCARGPAIPVAEAFRKEQSGTPKRLWDTW